MKDNLRQQLENLREENKKLKKALRQSYIDPISELWDRKFFETFRKKVLDSRNRIGIIYIDANRLKQLNDTFGHDIGDKYLGDIGKIIKKSLIRKSDFAFRLGGDEFIIVLVLTGKNHKKGIDIILDRIDSNLKIRNKIRIKNNEIEISFAKGAAIEKGRDFMTETVKEAEKLMYKHKKLQKQKNSRLAR